MARNMMFCIFLSIHCSGSYLWVFPCAGDGNMSIMCEPEKSASQKSSDTNFTAGSSILEQSSRWQLDFAPDNTQLGRMSEFTTPPPVYMVCFPQDYLDYSFPPSFFWLKSMERCCMPSAETITRASCPPVIWENLISLEEHSDGRPSLHICWFSSTVEIVDNPSQACSAT